jgi:Ca2+-binding RTX toxin-like protein
MSHNIRARIHLACALILSASMLVGSSIANAQGAPPDASPRAIPDCDGLPATIVGTPGADRIDGTAGNEVIAGLGGDDVIHGLEGDDHICSGPGNDVARGGPGSDGLAGEGGNDTLRCGPGFDDGGLSGGTGDDTLYGESLCSNALFPGLGDDLIVGGSPKEWTAVFYEDATGPIHANLLTGIATGQGTDTLVNVNCLFGSPYDDTLIGDNGDNWLVGRAGDDTLIGHGGHDKLSGEQDADIYRGGPGFDVAEYFDDAAADGREIGPMNVNLRTGIATGDGTDTLDGIEGATGSDKADTMIGDRKDNAFFWLYDGYDTVRGSGGDDFVESSAGPNALSGGPGRDLVLYLDGEDFDHQHTAVTVDLGAGTSSSGDILSGFEDVLGSPEGDTLIGDDGPNSLYGYLGNDVLSGAAGDDRLFGGRGEDEADGGIGADHCRAETQVDCESLSRRDRRPVPTHLWRSLAEWTINDAGIDVTSFHDLR